jgi:hypothetical protein
MRRSISSGLALACVIVLLVATAAPAVQSTDPPPDDARQSPATSPATNDAEFIIPFEQPEGLGPHEAIAPLSATSALGGAGGDGTSAPNALESEQAVAGPDIRTTNSAGTQSEISMAATAGGQNVVLAYNGGPQGLGLTSSQDGGRTFGAEFSAPVPPGSNPCCDPSVVGDAGNNFYLIQLFRDDGANAPAAGNCTNSLHVSTNGGATFGNIISSPFSYAPGSGQFPDQPHIGIDRNNPGPNLWVTTRHFTSGINCPQTGGSGTVQGEIVCSSDGGATWSNPLVWPQFTDTAHVGVGSDGRTYVAGMGIGTNANTRRVVLWRSTGTTCPGAGNTPAFTGPTVVADNLTFGASGIDREFVQPDVIVDPTNSNRVFVSYSADSAQGSGDREVFLATCTFPAGTCTPVTINDNPADGTQQYFVMTCMDPASNAIYASWTDARATPNHQVRAATITNNGTTVSASQQISDATWPIINPGGTPDYGDYNENNGACRANHHYAAWTSQVSPPGVTPASTSLDVFFTVVNDPPVADADGPYMTTEGTAVTLNGSATDTENDAPFTYEWDLDGDGQFDDATGPTPSFTAVGQDGVFPVCLRVTDSIGDSGESCSFVVVTNEAPTIDSLVNDSPTDEGSPTTVSGTASDPGWLDVLSATVDWGDGTPVEALAGTAEQLPPEATLAFSGSHVYGDNGPFTVEVCVADDDADVCDTTEVTVDNVDPDVAIDESGATLINGIPTFLAQIGVPLDVPADVTDPGSDDLTITWAWDDGQPDDVQVSLVNPPNPDPFPSPTVQPRNLSLTATHTYLVGCLYEVVVTAVDDDGGSGFDTADVVIVGDADQERSAGYWHHQFRQKGKVHLDLAMLQCLLDIVGYMSTVFDEVNDASTPADALAILTMGGHKGDAFRIFDRQLLAVWLNFANGAVGFGDLVDTDDDGVPDTPFAQAVADAEAVRLDPTSSKAEILDQKDILEAINVGAGG